MKREAEVAAQLELRAEAEEVRPQIQPAETYDVVGQLVGGDAGGDRERAAPLEVALLHGDHDRHRVATVAAEPHGHHARRVEDEVRLQVALALVELVEVERIAGLERQIREDGAIARS